jgi:hypothetical protein
MVRSTALHAHLTGRLRFRGRKLEHAVQLNSTVSY